jgi:transposase
MAKRTLTAAEQAAQLLQRNVKTIRADGSESVRPISIRQAAREFGVSDRTMRRWLKAESQPRAENVDRLYDAATKQRRANVTAARRAHVKLDLEETYIVPRIERTERIVQRRIVEYKDRKPVWKTTRGKSDTMRVPVFDVRGSQARSILPPDFVGDLASQYAGVSAYNKDAMIMINYVAPDYNEEPQIDDETGEEILPPLKRYAYGLHKDRKTGRRAGGWISISDMSESEVRRLIDDATAYASKAGGTITTVYIRDPRLHSAAPKAPVRVVPKRRRK